MEIKEVGPASWKPDRDRWIREAMAGGHAYGRYTWNLRLDGACPSPSPSPSPSSTGPQPSASATGPRPTATPRPEP